MSPFNCYSFGDSKSQWTWSNFCDDVRALFCPARLEPSYLILPAQLANVSKDLQEKYECHRALSKYFCLHFLIDQIFILQNIYFCSGCLSRSYEICSQATFSRWRRCERIQIVNFKSGQTRAESTCSSCWASECGAEFVDVAKKIMKTVSLSCTQPVA